MELSNRQAIINRAKEIMDKLSINALDALIIAEQEIEEQMKMGELENE